MCFKKDLQKLTSKCHLSTSDLPTSLPKNTKWVRWSGMICDKCDGCMLLLFADNKNKP